MAEPLTPDQVFIRKITDIVLEHLGHENFGVSDLAKESGTSLYRLNRRLKSVNKKTCSQFIREIRLEKALEMLINEEYTVAEIAYRTGFGSSNYFNKCFHEYYGYSPGKVKRGGIDRQTFSDLVQPDEKSRKVITRKSQTIFSFRGILLLTLISGTLMIFLSGIIKRSELSGSIISSDGRISVAIMPFRNLTNDTTWSIWQEGIQTSLTNFLSNSGDLVIKGSVNEMIQSRGITDYAALTPSLENQIAQKLNAKVYLSGNIIKSGQKVRVSVQIVDAGKKESLQSYEVEENSMGEMNFQIIDSLRHQVRDFLIVTKLKKTDPSSSSYFFDPIRSPEAYRCMATARKAIGKSDFSAAADMYKLAISIDSNIYDAYYGLAIAYGEQGDWENCKIWLLRYYSKRDRLNVYNKLLADYLYAITFKTPYDAIRCAQQMATVNDQAPYNYVNIADEYNRLFQYDKAIPEYEKALKIYDRLGFQPHSSVYIQLGKAYHNTGNFRKESKLYRKAKREFSDNPLLVARLAILSLSKNDTVSANKYIKEYKLLRGKDSWSEARIINGVAIIYQQGSYQDKAEMFYRQALNAEPSNIVVSNSLGFFLIDNNRNIDEGLRLLDEALRISPDDYSLLDSKGWGLYKKGKYREALDILQRSWDLRMLNARYDHSGYLHLEEVKKAAARQI